MFFEANVTAYEHFNLAKPLIVEADSDFEAFEIFVEKMSEFASNPYDINFTFVNTETNETFGPFDGWGEEL